MSKESMTTLENVIREAVCLHSDDRYAVPRDERVVCVSCAATAVAEWLQGQRPDEAPIYLDGYGQAGAYFDGWDAAIAALLEKS